MAEDYLRALRCWDKPQAECRKSEPEYATFDTQGELVTLDAERPTGPPAKAIPVIENESAVATRSSDSGHKQGCS